MPREKPSITMFATINIIMIGLAAISLVFVQGIQSSAVIANTNELTATRVVSAKTDLYVTTLATENSFETNNPTDELEDPSVAENPQANMFDAEEQYIQQIDGEGPSDHAGTGLRNPNNLQNMHGINKAIMNSLTGRRNMGCRVSRANLEVIAGDFNVLKLVAGLISRLEIAIKLVIGCHLAVRVVCV